MVENYLVFLTLLPTTFPLYENRIKNDNYSLYRKYFLTNAYVIALFGSIIESFVLIEIPESKSLPLGTVSDPLASIEIRKNR